MKRQIFFSFTIALLILSLNAPSAPAAPIIRISGTQPAHTVEVLELDDWTSLGRYGEGDTFRTFCLESGEYFRSGRTYYADISTAAVMGGESVSDPLDEKTAYIYTRYINGEYAGVSELDVQKAIWYLEDEDGGVNNSLVSEAAAAVSSGAWSGIGDVRVMNLWQCYDPQTDTYSGWAQDQLITVSVIPAPSAIMLSSVGLLAVRWLRRRKRL
ncbi:MAG TPA: hypothetical protein HPP87_10250 [Planctomycetes bacterium]|nr:hypothetical protein [Planctomycetota bacterium]